ncbi:secreted protein [Candidatus Thiomargarita nelsonii]|uniref:Secreted protein n=1 Tax=Candidatus Thiomargarita nelsonii TaxID=1003181 RepID=A0A176RV72_9GAMM|nr:secreted protein [Candidatus Thiomargarita nelsonii]
MKKTSNLQHKSNVSPLGTPLPLSLAITAALAVSNPLSAANVNVTQAIDNGDDSVNGSLSWAIRQANVAAGDDTITLTTDVTIQNVMTNLINSNVEIEGNSHTVSGNSQFRPFFVLSGTVILRDLTVSDGLAKGGDGGVIGSGGGAGLGGALFVYDGAVTVENVTFSNNRAVGGDSSGSDYCGGGMGDGCGLFSLKEGEVLAEKGDIEAATAKFKEAEMLLPDLNLKNLEKMAAKTVAQMRLKEGEELLGKDEIEAAVTLFKEALVLDAQLQSSVIDYTAELLMQEGEQLAREGDIEGAVARFKEARQLTPQLEELNIEELAALWINQEEVERKEWWETVEIILESIAAVGAIAALIVLL